MKIVSQGQMRELFRKIVRDYGVPSLALIESFAIQFSETLNLHFKIIKNKKIAIVCGHDYKGILGFAIARHLVTRYNASVEIIISEKIFSFSSKTHLQYKMAENFGIKINSAGDYNFSKCDLIIDALPETTSFFSNSESTLQLIRALNESGRPIVAVHAPSGLNTDSGAISSAVIKAQLTVTFNLIKYGLLVYPAAHYVGELAFIDVGLPQTLIDRTQITTFTIESNQVKTWLPSRKNHRDLNKNLFGHVAVFAGSSGYLGAAVLTAEAAQRTGAGSVTLALPDFLEQSVLSRLSPVIMTHALSQTRNSTLSIHAVPEALSLAQSAKAAALGPGIGLADEVAEFVYNFTASCPVPLVIDADALTLLSRTPDRGKSIIKNRIHTTILTPHPAELARLLNISTLEVQNDRIAAIQLATQVYECVVVLKGTHTLISDFSGKIYLNTNGNSGLATAGTGDVLTGIIASFLAQGLEDLVSAAAAVFIHGLAADIIQNKLQGNSGINAVDLVRHLPQAIAKCLNESV